MLAVKSSNKSNDLPLFAQLAFAVRCARRVVNLFRLQSNHPELATCCKSLGTAIRLTESFAAGNDVDANELAMAEAGTLRAVVAASEMHPPNERSASAANAAYAALCAVKAALETRGCKSPAEGADRVAEAAKIARDSANSANENVERSARLDWEMLHRMCVGHFPDFGEPIDASENGLLGPLFQDFSRGVPSNSQPTTGGAEDRNKFDPVATGRAQSRKYTELAGTTPTSAWAKQIAQTDGLHKQIEADRLLLQADRAAFDAANQVLQMQLEGQKSEFERQRLTAEQRAAELAAAQEELDDREMQFAKRHAAHEEELRRQEQELTSSRLELEAERNVTHATFDSLEEERREFLEQRLSWNPASPRS